MKIDKATALEKFKADVIEGLSKKEKTLPCKYFYDERGSDLFEKITTLEEYYPTRTELAIMEANIDAMAKALGDDVTLIEFGSGSSMKTELLLSHARIKSYIPIDIAEDALLASADRLRSLHPSLTVQPVVADYTEYVTLPAHEGTRNVIYFPGSTIGNFTPEEAHDFLSRMRDLMGDNGALLIGIDLKKDIGVLERAYNDVQGVTAEFNLNLIDRINSELRPEPPLDGFEHMAIYNEREGRIEMRLISQREQEVSVGGAKLHFEAGEAITTEYSYKYALPDFVELAARSDLSLKSSWLDEREYFAVLFFQPTTGR